MKKMQKEFDAIERQSDGVGMERSGSYGTYAPVKTPYMGIDPTCPDNEQKLILKMDEIIMSQRIEALDQINSDDRQSRRQMMVFLPSGDLAEQAGFSNKVWKESALRILQIIVKFVIMLLKNSEKHKFTFMDHRQFSAINDKSAFFQYYLENNLIRKRFKISKLNVVLQRLQSSKLMANLTTSVRQIVRKVHVIQPDSTFKQSWDIIMFIILTITFFYVPLKIGFQLQSITQQYTTLVFFLELLPASVVLIDIVMNFMTGYYRNGELMMGLKQITNRYVKEQFVGDLVITAPFILAKIGAFDQSYIELVILLKFQHLVAIFDKLEDNFNIRENFSLQIDVFKLLSLFVLISHVSACSWHLLGYLQEQHGVAFTWIEKAQMTDKNWLQRYITSIYWSSITTLTIGYGDITPQTDIEKAFVVVIAIMSSVVFGYTISSIGTIFSQIQKNTSIRRDKMSLLVSFMHERGVSTHLLAKVKKFSQIYFEMGQQQQKNCDNMIGHLSDDLKTAMKIEIYKKKLLTSILLRDTFSAIFIEQLCQIVCEKTFVPGEKVFHKDELVNQMIIINQGEIQLYIESGHSLHDITEIKQGQVLGERQFISAQKSIYSALSKQFTNVCYIQYEDFSRLLEQYPLEKQKYLELRDKLSQKVQPKVFCCELCRENHFLLECDYTFYKPSIRRTIKNQYSVQQIRINQSRSTKFQFRDLRTIQEGVIAFGLENGYLQENQIDHQFIELYGCPFLKEIIDGEGSMLNNDLKNIQEGSSIGGTNSPKSLAMSKTIKGKSFGNQSLEKIGSVYDDSSKQGGGLKLIPLMNPKFKPKNVRINHYAEIADNTKTKKIHPSSYKREKQDSILKRSTPDYRNSQTQRDFKDIKELIPNHEEIPNGNSPIRGYLIAQRTNYHGPLKVEKIAEILESQDASNIGNIYRKSLKELSNQVRLSISRTMSIQLPHSSPVIQHGMLSTVSTAKFGSEFNQLEIIRMEYLNSLKESLESFDEMRQYENYFTQFNIDKVLFKFKVEVRKALKSRRKRYFSKRSHHLSNLTNKKISYHNI